MTRPAISQTARNPSRAELLRSAVPGGMASWMLCREDHVEGRLVEGPLRGVSTRDPTLRLFAHLLPLSGGNWILVETSSPSSTSRTFLVSKAGVIGFWTNATPVSRTP